jgi:cytochrome c
MRRLRLLPILGVFFVLFYADLGICEQDQGAECKRMVDSAIALFKDKGNDYAIKVLNTSAGPYRKGELYVYAMSFDGLMMAHAANRDLLGKSQHDMRDAKGKLLFPPMKEVAESKEGAGWVDYWWLRHGEAEPTLKRTYIKRVPGQEILLGAGYYVK